MSIDRLVGELGYTNSPFYVTDAAGGDLSISHLLRDSQRANVIGTYVIEVANEATGQARYRPAVQIAEANTADDARRIHRELWNQGSTPFLIVSLPAEVRVYTGFAFDESNERVGQVGRPIRATDLGVIAEKLRFLRADSIDSGNIWQEKGQVLQQGRRVHQALLDALKALSDELVQTYGVERETAHAITGRFVYLHYLRDRRILSDEWLADQGILSNDVFSSEVKYKSFRRLTDAVDDRFNGRIFPIDWSASAAPSAEVIRTVGRAFAGHDVRTGQGTLFSPFEFSFLPIELLSQIYEQFLHQEGKGKEEGAFYTRPPVVDYLIAEMDSVNPLTRGMKVLDPCCGSGVFLVLAYRQLVERELRRRGVERLKLTELRQILTESIFGVERIEEACQVTEFSLILAMLSYITPPELHSHTNFKFPRLRGEQTFQCDFFDDDSQFWKANQRFDWIVGNPPWRQLDSDNPDDTRALRWINEQAAPRDMPVARNRSSEAFSWRVCDRLADKGAAGLVIQATSLTNDQSTGYRKAFFHQNRVRRISNLANLAYLLFESAQEPGATVVYSPSLDRTAKSDIVHFGPMVINQRTLRATGRRGVPWVITVSESEIQVIDGAEAESGKAATWKQALWGSRLDRWGLARLRRLLPTTLQAMTDERGWSLNMGLQLRPNEGSAAKKDSYHRELAGLKVLEPPAKDLWKTLVVPRDWVKPNRFGCFVRQRGGTAGLNITRAPHLFLWKDFAAFSDGDFIVRHPDVGLSADQSDEDWLRAISVFWRSSLANYYMMLELSGAWGIGRSRMDLTDARRMPLPEFTAETVKRLAALHRSLTGAAPDSFELGSADEQLTIDATVAEVVGLSSKLRIIVEEFARYKLPLVKGKTPKALIAAPDEAQLQRYAARLKTELDSFLERKPHRHKIVVAGNKASGFVASVELVKNGTARNGVEISGEESSSLREILECARQQYGQWVYVNRSVRVIANDRIYICKPPQRTEWTETRAILDAADVISEANAVRGYRQ